MEKDKTLQLKEAISMVTGRRTKLPPSIYKNPVRMQSGGWKIIEQFDENSTTISPKVELPVNTTAPKSEPTFLDEKTKALRELYLGTSDESTETPKAETKKRGRKSKSNNI